MIALDEIMKQSEDSQFAQLLCRVLTATCTEDDVYPRNCHVVVIKAIDKTNDKHTQLLHLKPSENKAETGGLVRELHLAVGAKVMLTVNSISQMD